MVSSKLFIWASSISCLICVSLGAYDPADKYFIDCGSPTNTSVVDRVFVADRFFPNLVSSTHNTPANTSSNPASSRNDSDLYRTARIFDETSHYTFSINKHGRHWIRLYFFPFDYRNYNLSMAKFSVSAQNFIFIKEYKPKNGPEIREYSVNVTSDRLVLTFTPSPDSFAFVNALEMFSLPDELIPEGVRTINSESNYQHIQKQALETVERVNMGNVNVYPQNDALWRLWVSDDAYLRDKNIVTNVSYISAVNFTRDGPTENIAPASVYGTATRLNSDSDPNTNANVTWFFNVDPGFEYLVRFHFCDILRVDPDQPLYFNVYIGSLLACEHDLDLPKLTSNILGAPYFLDVIATVSDTHILNVSVGPSKVGSSFRNAFLNGLEIMKISNSKDSLDVLDAISSKSSKKKVILIVVLVVGLFVAVVLASFLCLMCRRKLARMGHPKTEELPMYCRGTINTRNGATSEFGYRFPFVAIQEATDNFSESLLLGVAGFGRVYKGVLSDGLVVAVKRGTKTCQSQGIAEFRNEIVMLSQFRHRHLVSLIGYCEERNEMIILYEFMENGTLKDHLCDSNFPSLSWKKRLEICIGAAKGLHYLHTGPAKPIIHRDVKSANILLDENLMAKVADFGISKTGPEIDQTHVSTAVKGSFGYLDPEYLIRQQLNEKSDVYSFGVVMLEVLCGRPVIDRSLPTEKVNLTEWALKCLKRGQPEEIVDPLLDGQVKFESFKKFGDIAQKCLAPCGVDRPSMGDVLWNLEHILQAEGIEK